MWGAAASRVLFLCAFYLVSACSLSKSEREWHKEIWELVMFAVLVLSSYPIKIRVGWSCRSAEFQAYQVQNVSLNMGRDFCPFDKLQSLCCTARRFRHWNCIETVPSIEYLAELQQVSHFWCLLIGFSFTVTFLHRLTIVNQQHIIYKQQEHKHKM